MEHLRQEGGGTSGHPLALRRPTQTGGAIAAFVALACLATITLASGRHAPSAAPSGARAKLPLSFIPNRGQTDARVRYYAKSAAFGAYFTDRGVTLDLHKRSRAAALQLRFPGANLHAKLVPAARAPGRVNYFTGHRHYTGLPTYQEIRYPDLWPGIDLVFRGVAGQLKYELRLRPGADASRIRFAYAGADSLSLDRGALVVGTPAGPLRDAPPVTRQEGQRVPTRYVVDGQGYGFALAAYDRGRPLVIDPGLVYSTYLGGASEDVAQAISVGVDGSAYITGGTSSSDFPATPGAYDQTNSYSDAFVTKLNPNGALAYSTFLGGTPAGPPFPSGTDTGRGIAVDGLGDAYVFGNTNSNDFPTTAGAYRTQPSGSSSFVTKLNPAGNALVYSTMIGPVDTSSGAIAVDGQGHAYVTGGTFDPSYPTTPGAFRTTYPGSRGVYVTKLSDTGGGLDYSTWLGNGAGYGIAADSQGRAYVTGSGEAGFPTTPGAYDTTPNGNGDAFVAKLNPAGSGLDYGTLIGGGQTDEAFGLAIDGGGSAYVTGYTASNDYPTTPGSFATTPIDTNFATKVNPSGTALAYSTYLPGQGRAIAVNSDGEAYVTGLITSASLPQVPFAFDATYNGNFDAFLTKLDSTGARLLYATYLGGSERDIGWGVGVAGQRDAYVAGETASSDFPTTPGAVDSTYGGSPGRDGFVSHISIPPPDAYVRPKGATPALFSLVPANVQCMDPTITHGTPLSYPSCAGPQLTSSYLTTGTPDANGKLVRMQSSLLAKVHPGDSATPANEADVSLTLNVNDVFTKALDDYTGGVRALISLRITGKDPSGNLTTIDFPFGFNASCVPDPDPAIGSICDATTSVNAVLPGAVQEGQRAIWALDRARVFDGGPDGDPTTAAGNTQFLTQGLFVP